jgi:hypothetical protein
VSIPNIFTRKSEEGPQTYCKTGTESECFIPPGSLVSSIHIHVLSAPRINNKIAYWTGVLVMAFTSWRIIPPPPQIYFFYDLQTTMRMLSVIFIFTFYRTHTSVNLSIKTVNNFTFMQSAQFSCWAWNCTQYTDTIYTSLFNEAALM